MKPRLTIIIPVRKEEETIASTLDSLSIVKTPHTIVVVSDILDKNDKTEEIVSQYAKRHRTVRLLKKHIGRDADGFSHALSRGAQATRTPFVVFVMADMCDDPKLIDRMYHIIQRGWDVVCASRYMKGGKKIGGPVVQGWFSFIINLFLYHVVRLPTHDVSNSYKMYTRSCLSRLSFDMSTGVETSLSLFLQAYKRGERITEVPTTWTGRTKGESKFQLWRQIIRYSKVFAHLYG